MIPDRQPPDTSTAPASADRYLSIEGARLHYRDEGRGPAVLLLHGWALDLEMWEPQVAQLRDAFRLVRFDRRGFGLSSGEASLRADAADALSLCDRLQLERIACVGMSQGARVALRLCQLAPERLSCVVLDGPPRDLTALSAEEASDVPLSEYRELIARGDLETLRRQWQRHPLTRLETRDSHSRSLLQRMIARYCGRDLLQASPAPEDRWNPATLASLRTPALVLTGQYDLAERVRAADQLAGMLPVAERAMIASARHISNLDNPPAYNAVLRAFLERHAIARP
jgi:pimeloyl-ACP methyl ester carboxylesterase